VNSDEATKGIRTATVMERIPPVGTQGQRDKGTKGNIETEATKVNGCPLQIGNRQLAIASRSPVNLRDPAYGLVGHAGSSAPSHGAKASAPLSVSYLLPFVGFGAEAHGDALRHAGPPAGLLRHP
jgi:hypothetical protein